MEHNVCAGRWLSVDLERSQIAVEQVAGHELRTWLLGSGFAAHLLSETWDLSLDPLHPHSPLLVFNGLLTGTFAPGAARTSWCGRSPLTGIWNESNVGGFWGAELRFVGFDGVVVRGRASSPVYLWIRDGQAEIRDGSAVWGLGTFETYDRLREETDDRAQVATIGPAGENLVRMAGVMVGGQAHNRAAGRAGNDRLASNEETVRVVIDFQNYMATYNPLGLCKFMVKGGLDPARTTELLNAAAGWEWSADDLLRTGERFFNLKRLINLRLGITGADDALPQRFVTEPRPSGTAADNVPDMEDLLPRYYARRGWSPQGRPTPECLERLGLGRTDGCN